MRTIDFIVSSHIDAAIEKQSRAFKIELGKRDGRLDQKIEDAIERERLIFVDVLKTEREFWRDDFKLVIEIVKDKPSRSEVQEMIEAHVR